MLYSYIQLYDGGAVSSRKSQMVALGEKRTGGRLTVFDPGTTLFSMKILTTAAFLMVLVATPVWAGESGTFDPDQPFKALGHRLLDSVFGQVLEALDDHFDITGNFNTDSAPDQKKNLKFKFYPNGKSKSDDHITAEGWFGPSKDSLEEEFRFLFTIPKYLTESVVDLPENVL